MPTFTSSSFECIESEDYAYAVQGAAQNWNISSVLAGFSGSGYIESSGASTGGSFPQSAVAYIQNYTVPTTPSFVWFRVGGSGDFVVDYANDGNFETITVNGGWTWIKASNQLTNQSQIQIIGSNPGVLIDKIIISTAVETPTDPEGFTNTNTGGNGTGTGGGNGSSTDGDCYGTGTTSCFNNYEAESAFWLEAGSQGNFQTIQASDVSNLEYIRSPSNPSVGNAPTAHIAISPVITSSWNLWVRARGTGTIFHTNADDDANAASIIISTSVWSWFMSPLFVDPNAAKIKLSTFNADMDIDSIVLIDRPETPSDIDGFCLDNGSGSGGGGGTTNPPPTGGENTEDDINSQNHLWLPENLNCKINVIPHELTNK